MRASKAKALRREVMAMREVPLENKKWFYRRTKKNYNALPKDKRGG